MLQIISENFIRNASLIYDDSNNPFDNALKQGDIFKNLNLTPIYLYNHNTKIIYTTTKERMENNFH